MRWNTKVSFCRMVWSQIFLAQAKKKNRTSVKHAVGDLRRVVAFKNTLAHTQESLLTSVSSAGIRQKKAGISENTWWYTVAISKKMWCVCQRIYTEIVPRASKTLVQSKFVGKFLKWLIFPGFRSVSHINFGCRKPCTMRLVQIKYICMVVQFFFTTWNCSIWLS